MLFSAHKIYNQLSALLGRAEALGLPLVDITASKEYLQYNEYELCLEQVITQLYEYDIEIDSEFYKEVESTAKLLAISQSSYEYIAELIRK
ncbi:MAG: MafI family immunity protein [Bacteroidota bacterium]